MPDQDIIALLLQLLAEEKQIDQAIAIDIQPQSNWGGQWQYCSLNAVASLPFDQRYDLAIVNLIKQQTVESALESLEITDTTINNAVVRMRDLFAKKIIIFAPLARTKQLRSLGFNQLLEIVPEDSPVQIWQFNILTYKHVPDWFNSKFWANPENWNKFRW
ncbi:hypothetical protein SAMN05421749_10116 [Acinetobacter marinus]|uniref:Uncharacterized protein n=1 Tax=Acinetobacter marinus TaxID=281375 RepID=A0A1G6GIA6_9GAMM|nr:DUF6231 family protein [Acinetobacter marinus]SDB81737.1 hypothetical protein SAMN05421749_10116 [Acinetobacter marinus]